MTMCRFPLREKQSTGFVISLSGVLGRAAEQCRRSRDNKHLAYPLQTLEAHINELRASTSDEEALEKLEAFLRLWVES
jgi:hypothetical protein